MKIIDIDCRVADEDPDLECKLADEDSNLDFRMVNKDPDLDCRIADRYRCFNCLPKVLHKVGRMSRHDILIKWTAN